MISSFEQIYQEMRTRNLRNIKSDGLTYDSLLLNQQADSRKAFGLFALFDEDFSQGFQNVYENAFREFPEHIIYHSTSSPNYLNHGLLHFTFLQLIRTGNVSYPLPKKLIMNYFELLRMSVLKMEPFEVKYQGLIALPGNIVMTGYPTFDINILRDEIRENIGNLNLLYDEPYKSDTAHSTLIRFATKEKSTTATTFSKKYESYPFGVMKVDKLYLGYGTWKMNLGEIEMLYEFNLKTKEIISLIE